MKQTTIYFVTHHSLFCLGKKLQIKGNDYFTVIVLTASWGWRNWPARGPSELKVIRIVRQSNLLIDNQLYLIPVPALRVSGFTLSGIPFRVKPRARPAGTLYNSGCHRPIYGFNLMNTLCCPVFCSFGAVCPLGTPRQNFMLLI